MAKRGKIFFQLILILIFALAAAAMGTMLGGCSNPNGSGGDSIGLKIVATIFPNYDFAKQIVKDKAEVILLIPPGIEAHSYDPSPRDIVNAATADIFIYTSSAMEPWAEKIIHVSENNQLMLVESGQGIALKERTEGEQEDEHGHGTHSDPHIWVNPLYAIKMAENIKDAVIKADPANRAYYEENFNSFAQQLQELDKEIEAAMAKVKSKTIIYGGHFVFGYFAERYQLDFVSPYKGFSPEAEPTAMKLAELINTMKELGVKVIYYEELLDPKIARIISEQTGAKMLLLNGGHNVTKEDLEKGVTYIDIMKKNLENLKQGLGYDE